MLALQSHRDPGNLTDSMRDLTAGFGLLAMRHHVNRTALHKGLVALTATIIWSFFLLRTIDVFGPGSANVDFSSDSAIPVLMSVDKSPVTIFNLYYYGTDRWGAWPFLITQLVGHVTGYQWSAESIFVLQATWAVLGSLVMAALSRRDAAFVAAVYLVALCLHRDARYMLFQMSQLYAWQTTALLLGWLGLRLFLESFFQGTPRYRRCKLGGWFSLSLVASYLAISSSVASIPLLCALLVLEILRARGRWAGTNGMPRILAASAIGFVAVLLGALAERGQKMLFHQHSKQYYGHSFKTKFSLDTEYFSENIARHWHSIAEYTWWPLYVLPILAVCALIALGVHASIRKSSTVSDRLRTILSDDTAILAIGSFLIALLTFGIVIVVNHVRLNNYDDRYLTHTNLFGPISGMLVLYLALRAALSADRMRRYAELASIAVALGILTIAFPARGESARYRALTHTARAIADKAPNAFLVGNYWDTYVFAALQPNSPMIPVPKQGQENRMPWTVELLREADYMIVVYRRGAADLAVGPPRTMDQYGAKFELSDDAWYEDAQHVFVRYSRVRPGSEGRSTITYDAAAFSKASCATGGGDGVISATRCPEGVVLFGPYAHVPAGSNVEFTFEIATDESDLAMSSELVSAAGATFHGSIPYQKVEPGLRKWVGQRIYMFTAVDKLESRIRIHAKAGATFKLYDVALTIR
jgi:hypothetical protein